MADQNYGRFVWRELMAANVDAAKRFYGELFGWTTQEFPGEKPYYIFQAGGVGIGGLMACPEDTPMPSHWTSYVAVSDVDACVERAKSAAGKILYGPVDLPTVGRLAYIGDPNGAVTAVIKPQPPDEKRQSPPRVGCFCWESLQTPNPKADVAFYRTVYGWSEATFEGSITLGVGEGMLNQIASVGPTQSGVPPHWATYVSVDSLAAARERVKRLGGRVLVEAVTVPTMGAFSVILDPEQAVICLFEEEKR